MVAALWPSVLPERKIGQAMEGTGAEKDEGAAALTAESSGHEGHGRAEAQGHA